MGSSVSSQEGGSMGDGDVVGVSVRGTVGLTVGVAVGDIVFGVQHASTHPTGTDVEPT